MSLRPESDPLPTSGRFADPPADPTLLARMRRRLLPISTIDPGAPSVDAVESPIQGTAEGLGARVLPAWLKAADLHIARPRSARNAVVWLAAYLLLAANWPLWLDLARLGGAPSVYMGTVGAMALIVGLGTVSLLALTAWSRWMKPLWLGVVLLAAVVQHYMLAYHVVIDPSMVANAMQTDLHEARDLFAPGLLIDVLLVAVVPAVWLWRIRLRPQPLWSQVWRNALLCVVALSVGAGAALAMSRELAPLMRNNVQLRYMMNPLAPVYSAGAAVLKPLFARSRKLLPITAGAALGPSYARQAKPPLFVLVVGETARADHFALNGYGRDTTPALAARNVLSWQDVRSCGTNTLASVPCMFSHLGKLGYEARRDEHENLLDVLQAAGLAVMWIDNQPGGCKGVCLRVPHAAAADGLAPEVRAALCDSDECLDDALLKQLDARLESLPPQQRERGIVLVMHQMGSHGPAYYKRSAPDAKRFMPECRTNVLADCSHGELMNAYDNSIAYTDQFLGRTIDWLQARSDRFATGLVYLSDHGESLGEYGLFLHGLPYGLAPDVQKQVPLVAWLDGGLARRDAISVECLRRERGRALSHDNLYHTVLGLMDVNSPTYQGKLDAFANCRGAAG